MATTPSTVPTITGSVSTAGQTGSTYVVGNTTYQVVDVSTLYQTDRATLNRAATAAGPAQATVAGINTALPIIYGTARVGARITAVTVYNGNLVLRCAWCIGAVDAVSAVYMNDEALPSGVTVEHFTGTTTQVAPQSLKDAFPGYNDNLAGDGLTKPGVCYSVVTIPPGVSSGFPRLTAEIRGMKVSSTEGGAKAYSANPAYAVADFIESSIHGMGRAVDWTTVATVATACSASVGGEAKRLVGLVLANPQSCETWLNVLREYAGCWAVPEGAKYRLIPDAMPATGTVRSIGSPGITKANPPKITTTVAHGYTTGKIVQIASVNGMTQINGAIGVVLEDTATTFYLTGIDSTSYATWSSGGTVTPIETSAYQFGASSIQASSLRAAKRGVLQAPTVVEVVYTDVSGTPWRDGVATCYAAGVLAGTTPRRTSRISMPGITRYSEAYRWATERLNKAQLADLTVSFTAFDAAIKLQVGDLIDVTHPVGLTAKILRVSKIDPIESGRWAIVGAEWDPAVYSSDVVTVPSVSDTIMPSPAAPPAVAAVDLIENVYLVETGRYASRIRAAWAEPSFPFTAFYAVEVLLGSATVDAATVPVGTTSYTTPPLAESQTYEVRVAVVSTLGVKGAAAVKTITNNGKLNVPSDVPQGQFTGYEIGGEVRLEWTSATDLDLTAHEIRYGATTGSWDDAVLLDRIATPATRYTTRAVPEGRWRFWIKGLDSVRTDVPGTRDKAYPWGQESATAAYVDIDVTSDSGAYVANAYSFTTPLLFKMTEHTGSAGKFWVTDHAQTWSSLFTAAMSTYTNALYTYHTAAVSMMVSEIYDIGLSITGDWVGSFGYTLLDGTAAYSLDLNETGPEGAKTITGATNATPIQITVSGSHGYETGQEVEIASVGGNTAANGYRRITNTGASTFTLQDLTGANVTGNGTYTSGGTSKRWLWQAYTGLTAKTTARFVRMTLQTPTGTLLVTNPGEFRCTVVARSEGGTVACVATAKQPTVVEFASKYNVAVSAIASAIGSAGHYAMVDQIEVSAGRGFGKGRGLRFNGTTGSDGAYVNVGDHAQFEFGNGTTDSPFSIEAWVKISDTSVASTIVSKGSSTPRGEYWLRMQAGGLLDFYLVDASTGGYRAIYSSSALTENVWAHIAVTYDGTETNPLSGMKMYIDGVLQTGATISSGTYVAMEATTELLLISGMYDAANYLQTTTGVIDEVRIWNDVRTQAELLANKDDYISATSAGLVGYWKFDETSGYTASDSQTNTTTRNGTLGSGTQFNELSAAAPTHRWWRPYDGMDVYRFDAAGDAINGDVSWSFSGV